MRLPWPSGSIDAVATATRQSRNMRIFCILFSKVSISIWNEAE